MLFHPKQRTQVERQPLDGRILLKRISSIWGIPVERITPLKKEIELTKDTTGRYFEVEHAYALNERASRKDEMHELTHGAHAILMPEKERKLYSTTKRTKGSIKTYIQNNLWTTSIMLGAYPKKIQSRLKGETLAELIEEPGKKSATLREIKQTFAIGPISLAAMLIFLPTRLSNAGFIIGIKGIARTIEFALNRKPVQEIYRIHGTDGIILFMARPPRVFGAIETRLWRRRMINQGYLESNGGLTGKGIRLLKQIMPRERILERIRIAEQNREKE